MRRKPLSSPADRPVRMAARALAWLVAGGVGALGLCAAPLARAQADLPRVIQAPHYGDAVFRFFQADYFSAITTLMASQQLQRLSPHDDEAELLRGGMLLSYGLHRGAGDIFARLIDRQAAPAVRDRAWFHLAKARYQRGQMKLAEDALDRVQQTLPAPLDDERRHLKAQLLMARADHPAAASVLQGLVQDSPDARIARYNLGVAQIKAGDAAAGTATLDALGQDKATTDAQRALRDRANVALGFAALAGKQPAAARRYLERVPMEGPESNKALLAYGWAALDLKAPQFALVPWLKLQQREGHDAASLEARIAVPYVYAQMGARGQALQHYAQAIQAFERERVQLDTSIAALRSGQLIQSLLTLNPRGDLGEGWHMDELPDVPHAAHLTGLLAQHDFQEAFKNLRDLRFLGQHLLAWRDKVGMFQDMLATRRQAFAERQQQVQARGSAPLVPGLRQRIDALAAEVAQAEAVQDGVALADARQRDLLARLTRLQALTAEPDASPELAQARDRVRLLRGLLSWQLAQDAPARLWDARKALQSLRDQLAEAERREASLADALAQEPVRLDAFDARIQGVRPQIDALLPKLAALGAEQQTVVQDIAVAELTRQKDRLAAYTVQARFALAQLYDHAASAALPEARLRPDPAAGHTEQGAAHAPQP